MDVLGLYYFTIEENPNTMMFYEPYVQKPVML